MFNRFYDTRINGKMSWDKEKPKDARPPERFRRRCQGPENISADLTGRFILHYSDEHRFKRVRVGEKKSKKESIAEIMQSLRRIFKSIQQYSEEVLKEFGVTGPQLGLLKSLEQNEPDSIGGLSRKMFLHISTFSGIVDRLEERGYVVRRKYGPDRRVVMVHLTDMGKRIVARSPEPSQGKLLYGLQSLPLKEVPKYAPP
jgi:DNA-binding MarR family transcriptional regulator